MAEKNIKARVVHKHDIEANWLLATNFTPKQGEIIVYDVDENYSYERIKIGDGVQNVNELPFYAGSWKDLADKPFGSVEGKDYIVEEQSIVLGKAMGGTETYVPTTRPFSGFVEGQVYYVVFDGETYPAEYDSDLDGLSVDAVNLEIYCYDNDEITVCTVYSDPRKGETHTFGIYVAEVVTAQLDEKYIPDTIARMSDIPITNTSLSVAGAPADAKATGDAINAISTLVGDKAVSEQINAAIASIPEGFSGSWNDLEDRPLVMESVTIAYDGSTDGYVASAPALFYKVSDFVLTKKNIIGQSISLFNQDSVNTAVITEDMIMTLENPNSFVISEFVACIAEDNTIFNSYTFPEKGVYFVNLNGIYVTSLGAVNVGPFFDEKYIPYTIARREDIVQSDWSEGNQYSLSYVKNKTHYYCEGASMVKELSLTVTDADFTNIGPYITFEEGKKYKVVIDGVSDMCTAVHVEDAAAAKNYIELTPSIDGFGIVRSRLTGGVCTYISGVSLGDHVLSIYEDNELKQLDEMFIPDTIARVSDIEEVKSLVGDKSVSEQINTAAANNQSDWSVNDETSPAYVKNRPFYTTDVENLYLYNGTVAFEERTQGEFTFYISAGEPLNKYDGFYVGQGITIIFDEVEYNLTVKKSSIGFLYAGNVSMLNELYGTSEANTEEPFCYLVGSGFVAESNATEHKIIACVGISEDITIPHKYLGLDIWNGEGENSIVVGDGANVASGLRAFASGYGTTASGEDSHAEGDSTTASGSASHAEGYYANATASYAHAEGLYTIAASESQHVQGKYNVKDASSKYAHIVGNGTNATSRSNAHTVDWDGNAWFQGTIKIGGIGQDDEAAKELATQEYVDSAIDAIPTPDVSGQIETHNTSKTAHSDIRTAISDVSALVGDTAVSEQITEAIQNNKPKMTSITLKSANWTGGTNPWSQVVTVNGVTANSKVDLQPTAVQIVELQDNDIALMAENDDGVVTVYAIGSKPTVDYTMQALITEVVVV